MACDIRVSAYIDGFNFFETSKGKDWYPYGWCNWTKTIQNYSPGAQVRVLYFTSDISPRNRGANHRQKLHLLAMEKIAGAEIVKGQFRERSVRCRACDEPMRCARCGKDTKLTEKQTDVNIAIRLVENAIDQSFDRAFLVSADLDLIPAIRMALRRHDRARFGILFPPESVIADEFEKLESEFNERLRCRHLDLRLMERFPDDLPLRWGLALPKHWRKGAGRRPQVVENDAAVGSKNSTQWWEN